VKVLAIDIETSPNLADVWSLWKQNVSLNQLRESSRMICFAAQWEGDKHATFFSEWTHGQEDMIEVAHELLNEADTVLHYNGQRFDVPHLNREMLQQGLKPPSPYKQIDLLREVKNTFQFPSYKLAYVAPALGVGEKMEHEGHELWVKVLARDKKARRTMADYNKQDVELLFPLYYKLRPWIGGPSHGALTGEDVCPSCGSDDLRREGHAFLLTGKYQRYQCRDCGTWSRGTRRVSGTNVTRIAS
jgi:DNA polymerase elongation subunit (family B)